MNRITQALSEAAAIHERSRQLRQQVRSQREERRLLAEHRQSLAGSFGLVTSKASTRNNGQRA